VTRTLHLHHASGLALSLSTFGAAWLSCQVPLADGSRRQVILQRPARPDAATRRAYVGATIGRYANRIGQARITRGSQAWALQPNPGSAHQLHGGPEGFDQREWTVLHADATSARLALLSPHGDQGYPGALQAEVTYRLSDAAIEMEAVATTTAECPVCLTNHAYFNLDGDGAGTIDDHLLTVESDEFTPVDATGIPLAAHEPVGGTPFDFRTVRPLRPAVRSDHPQVVSARGIDHNLVIRGEGLRRAAAVASPRTGTRLEIWADQPGLQVYTGNFLDGSLRSARGVAYRQGDGIALEPQLFPDTPNHPDWPSARLAPGERYRSTLEWRFSSVAADG
jgi:galactose mutarotase-like enzyme